MARFRFNVRRMLGASKVHPVVSQRSLRALQLIDEAPAWPGPGWFDSSWDLVCGLEVRDAPPGNMGLNEWLRVCLAEPGLSSP